MTTKTPRRKSKTRKSRKILYAGIDYHKHYSVVHVLDRKGQTVAKGRVNGNTPEGFQALLGELDGQVRCVFESTINWGRLYDLLNRLDVVADVTLANPFKTRVIAEAQIKTDKLDARWLAELHRAGLIAVSHASSIEARRRKELLRQRCYWVKMRTSIRNRTHNILGAQEELEMPQVTDIFGKKGREALAKAVLPKEHHRFLLDQDLAMLKQIDSQVKEAEKWIAEEFSEELNYQLLLSVPGFGKVLAAVILSEIDGIERFPGSKKLCGYSGLAPTTSSSGGKTYHGRMMREANRWLKWAFVEGAWVAVGCNAYFGGIYRKAKTRGKKPNTAITIVAKRMCEITFRILKEQTPFQPFPIRKDKNPGGPVC